MAKNWRFYAMIVCFVAFAAALESRLFSLQINQGFRQQKNADEKSILLNAFQVKRGSIFIEDRSGQRYTLAFDKEGYKVWANPQKITDAKKTSTALFPILGIDQQSLQSKLSDLTQNYQALSNFVSKEQASKIRSLKLAGINLEQKDLRSYPFNDFMAHTLGFVSYQDNQPNGQYGLEEFYDAKLSGLDEDESKISQMRIGKSLLLSADYNIQLTIESMLLRLVENNKAESGSVVVMDPKTGEILGLSSFPKFDPNHYNEAKIESFKNNAIQENYEPGSVIKLLTMAAGLQEGAVTPSTTYDDKGSVNIKGTTIWNFDKQGRGVQTMTQVLEKSLNTGAVFVEQKINKVIFLSYFKKFGAGARTGIDLVGEAKGNIKNLFNFNDVDYAAASFGQGITATPIQIAAAVSAIANNGTMMRPHIVEKIINPDNSEEVIGPEAAEQSIKPFTAAQLTGMMIRVAENGFDKKAKIPGYLVAAKTGTAQIPDLEKGGYSNEMVHTMVGFAPAFNPKFVIVIRVDKPHGRFNFASDSLAPAFKELTQFLLNYYHIPPSEPIN